MTVTNFIEQMGRESAEHFKEHLTKATSKKQEIVMLNI